MNIDHRGSLGFGLGRYLINDLGHELAAQAGLQGVHKWRGSCEDRNKKKIVPTKAITMALSDDDEDDTPPRKSLERCTDIELFLNFN